MTVRFMLLFVFIPFCSGDPLTAQVLWFYFFFPAIGAPRRHCLLIHLLFGDCET